MIKDHLFPHLYVLSILDHEKKKKVEFAINSIELKVFFNICL